MSLLHRIRLPLHRAFYSLAEGKCIDARQRIPIATFVTSAPTLPVKLAHMKKKPPGRPRHADASHTARHTFRTLDTRTLLSSNTAQVVMDVSGHNDVIAWFGRTGAASKCKLHYKATNAGGRFRLCAFPPDTIGVLYYKQSLTSPTRLGELRFRLCRDLQHFQSGNDLRCPSGDPWHVSSLSIFTSKQYQELRKFLTTEGLLDEKFYPGLPPTLPANHTMPLRVLSDTFVLDLSVHNIRLDLMNDGSVTASRVFFHNPFTFRQGTKQRSLFSGRAIVRLEEHTGSPTPNNANLNIRVLEFLTPLQRLVDDKTWKDPEEGQLLMRLDTSTDKYRPKVTSFTKTRQTWIDFIAQSKRTL